MNEKGKFLDLKPDIKLFIPRGPTPTFFFNRPAPFYPPIFLFANRPSKTCNVRQLRPDTRPSWPIRKTISIPSKEQHGTIRSGKQEKITSECYLSPGIKEENNLKELSTVSASLQEGLTLGQANLLIFDQPLVTEEGRFKEPFFDNKQKFKKCDDSTFPPQGYSTDQEIGNGIPTHGENKSSETNPEISGTEETETILILKDCRGALEEKGGITNRFSPIRDTISSSNEQILITDEAGNKHSNYKYDNKKIELTTQYEPEKLKEDNCDDENLLIKLIDSESEDNITVVIEDLEKESEEIICYEDLFDDYIMSEKQEMEQRYHLRGENNGSLGSLFNEMGENSSSCLSGSMINLEDLEVAGLEDAGEVKYELTKVVSVKRSAVQVPDDNEYEAAQCQDEYYNRNIQLSSNCDGREKGDLKHSLTRNAKESFNYGKDQTVIRAGKSSTGKFQGSKDSEINIDLQQRPPPPGVQELKKTKINTPNSLRTPIKTGSAIKFNTREKLPLKTSSKVKCFKPNKGEIKQGGNPAHRSNNATSLRMWKY